jgi:hypothetical protein
VRRAPFGLPGSKASVRSLSSSRVPRLRRSRGGMIGGSGGIVRGTGHHWFTPEVAWPAPGQDAAG